MKKIPFDYYSVFDIRDWDSNFECVVEEAEAEKIFCKIEGVLLQATHDFDSDQQIKNVLLLSIPFIAEIVLGFYYFALSVQNSADNEIDLVSVVPELNFLKTGDRMFLKKKTRNLLVEKKPNFLLLRRVLRTLTWTKLSNILNVIKNPDIVAIGHNEILVQFSKESNKKVYFYQAHEIISKANKKYKKKPIPKSIHNLIYILVERFKSCYIFENDINHRLEYLVKRYLSEVFIDNFHKLESLYDYKELPKRIWTGTGTAYSFRLLAIAVKSKCGEVTGFAHATGMTLTPSFNSTTFGLLGELAIVDRFVEITPTSKQIINNRYSKLIDRKVEIDCIRFNPRFEIYRNLSVRYESKIRPTVIYLSTAVTKFTGWAMFSNMSYLEWQTRLSNKLDNMDIDLICQPHPEGVFSDKTIQHPLRDKYNTDSISFEKIIKKADVFLVDFIHSTTFSEILVTNKPIVRIRWNDKSRRYGIYDNNIQSIIDKRCRTISAKFNNKNLIDIDFEKLEFLLTNNWNEKVDSTQFVNLFIGSKK